MRKESKLTNGGAGVWTQAILTTECELLISLSQKCKWQWRGLISYLLNNTKDPWNKIFSNIRKKHEKQVYWKYSNIFWTSNQK